MSIAAKISIHAAQEGCDYPRYLYLPSIFLHFNPRSPRGLRLRESQKDKEVQHISIHAAQEGCDGCNYDGVLAERISIHAAQEGCDFLLAIITPTFQPNFNPRSPRGLRLYGMITTSPSFSEFQSTQPKRAATTRAIIMQCSVAISIHAAQEGCDFLARHSAHLPQDFNPRSPRGLRRKNESKNILH